MARTPTSPDAWTIYHLPLPTTEDVESLVQVVAMRCSRWLIPAGFLDGEAGDHVVDDADDALGPIQRASIARRIALGLRVAPPTMVSTCTLAW